MSREIHGLAPKAQEYNPLDELMAIMVDLPPHDQKNYWLEVRGRLLKMRYSDLERMKEEKQSIEAHIVSLEEVINSFK